MMFRQSKHSKQESYPAILQAALSCSLYKVVDKQEYYICIYYIVITYVAIAIANSKYIGSTETALKTIHFELSALRDLFIRPIQDGRKKNKHIEAYPPQQNRTSAIQGV